MQELSRTKYSPKFENSHAILNTFSAPCALEPFSPKLIGQGKSFLLKKLHTQTWNLTIASMSFKGTTPILICIQYKRNVYQISFVSPEIGEHLIIIVRSNLFSRCQILNFKVIFLLPRLACIPNLNLDLPIDRPLF